MSNTKRKDLADFLKSFKTPKSNRDKKKVGKPGSLAKVYLNKGKKAQAKRQLSKLYIYPDEAEIPKVKKSHLYDYS